MLGTLLALFVILVPAAALVIWYMTASKRALMAIYEEIPTGESRQGGVHVVYHTYDGLLLWVTQARHEFVLPPEEARRMLRRLRNFNLKWGFLAYGAVFIPLLTFGCYYSQLRKIRRQEKEPEQLCKK